MHLFKYAASLLVGLALAALGLAYAAGNYPGPAVFARLAADLPAIGAAAVFGLAVAAAAAGVALLAVSARRLRRRWAQARGGGRGQPATAAAAVSGGRGYRGNGYRDAGYRDDGGGGGYPPGYHDGDGYAADDEWDRAGAYR